MRYTVHVIDTRVGGCTEFMHVHVDHVQWWVPLYMYVKVWDCQNVLTTCFTVQLHFVLASYHVVYIMCIV